MRHAIQAVTLEGRQVDVRVGEPLPCDPRALAVVAAIRVFARYPVLDRVRLLAGSTEVAVTREEALALLGPRGFGALREPEGARQALADALRAYLGGGGAEGTP